MAMGREVEMLAEASLEQAVAERSPLEREVPRCVTLVAAAKHLGVSRWTLMKWLEQDCGLQFRVVGKGSRHLVRVDHLARVVARRSPRVVR
jgi:hypothetical protein